jgi:hypothetical protein
MLLPKLLILVTANCGTNTGGLSAHAGEHSLCVMLIEYKYGLSVLPAANTGVIIAD